MNEKEQLPMTEKENVRWRVANAHIDPDNYVFYPAKKQADIHKSRAKDQGGKKGLDQRLNYGYVAK